jgi:hypothetical protein
MKITQNAFLRKIRNINGGDWLKELKNVLTDIASDFKNENGDSLLTEDKKINASFLPVSPSLEGSQYVFVQGNGTELENGIELQNAYNLAKTMSPSADNRITVVVAPGEYGLTNVMTLDTEFVDLVSLTGNPDVFLDRIDLEDPFQILEDNSSTPDVFELGYCLNIDCDNTYVKGMHGKIRTSEFWEWYWSGTENEYNTYYLPIRVGNNLPNTIVENCVGGICSFGGFAFNNVLDPVDSSYEIITPIDVSSTIINCKASFASFGGFSTCSGTFIDCEWFSLDAYDNGDCFYGCTGLFIRCKGGRSSFRGASGTFIDCVGLNNSYSLCTGRFIRCKGNTGSFREDCRGYFEGCEVTGSIGFSGYVDGTFVNCVAGALSFGSNPGNTPAGKLYYCRMTSGTFGTVTLGGRTYYCIDGNGNTNNQ